MTDIPVFETERLILRGITIEDAPAYQKHFAHWHIIKNLTKTVPWPFPENGAEIFLREDALPKQGKDKWMWAICLKENQAELIGVIDLFREAHPANRGFWLAKKFQRNGYMTEAVIPITDYAFNVLGFEKMVFSNARGNKKSRRVKEKTGAELISVEQVSFHNPKWTEREIWELTKEKWQEFRSANGIKPQSPKL